MYQYKKSEEKDPNHLIKEEKEKLSRELLDKCANFSKKFGIEQIKKLLMQGANPNIQDKFGRTPLFSLIFRAKTPSILAVRLLLEYKADPNIQDEDGRTPLLLICREGNPNILIMRLLLESNANPNIQDRNGETCLHALCSINGFSSVNYPSIEAIKLLFEYKVDPDILNYWGETALHCAISSISDDNEIHIEVVKLFLENKADLNISRTNGNTPLCIACKKDNPYFELIELLLKNKADPDLTLSDTILNDLCGKRDFDFKTIQVIQLLLKYKADPNIRKTIGNNETNLHLICQRREDESLDIKMTKLVVKLLLAHKVDPNMHDRRGDSILEILCDPESPNIELLQLFIENGGDKKVLGDYSHKLMECAIRNDSLVFGIEIILNSTILNLIGLGNSNGHPLEKLIHCIGIHNEQDKVLEFFVNSLNNKKNIRMPWGYKNLSNQDKNCAFTFLLCLQIKKSEHPVFKQPPPIRAKIMNGFVNDNPELDAINETLEEFNGRSQEDKIESNRPCVIN